LRSSYHDDQDPLDRDCDNAAKDRGFEDKPEGDLIVDDEEEEEEEEEGEEGSPGPESDDEDGDDKLAGAEEDPGVESPDEYAKEGYAAF
jgi:hypothetical protein